MVIHGYTWLYMVIHGYTQCFPDKIIFFLVLPAKFTHKKMPRNSLQQGEVLQQIGQGLEEEPIDHHAT